MCLKFPKKPTDIVASLEAGHTVPLIWPTKAIFEAIAASDYEAVFLVDMVPVFTWNPTTEPFGGQLDRLRNTILSKPILLERIYSLKGKALYGDKDSVISVAFWLNNYTPEQLAALPTDFEVQYFAANGKAALMNQQYQDRQLAAKIAHLESLEPKPDPVNEASRAPKAIVEKTPPPAPLVEPSKATKTPSSTPLTAQEKKSNTPKIPPLRIGLSRRSKES